jgi:hypothetical protein
MKYFSHWFPLQRGKACMALDFFSEYRAQSTNTRITPCKTKHVNTHNIVMDILKIHHFLELVFVP